MKAKKEFYLYGNDRKFHDDYIVSIMTGEPMPRKWQQFLELSPEEKARWDASLRLDAEYRIAEAQGFPNGIPGGKTRGNALYTFTQMEEERERNLLKSQIEETLNPYGQYFSPYKTDMQVNTSDIFGNIEPSDNLWQNPFDTWKNNLTAGISAPSALQTENKPAFDLRQAIKRLTEHVRASMNQQIQTNEMKNGNTAMIPPANDSTEPDTYDSTEINKNNASWVSQAIYDVEDKVLPQTSIFSGLAATGASLQSLVTGFSSYQLTSHMVNLSGSSATPLAANASNTVQSYTNSNANSSSVKAQGYGNGDIYSEKSYSIDEIRKVVESIVISIAEKAMNDLVGLADTILDVVLTVWKFGRVTNLVLGTASLVIGVCYVATQTQKKWESEKAQVLAEYKPEDEVGRKNAAARRVAEIFMDEAMAYFVGDWAGYIAEEAKESSKWKLVVKWGVGKFLDCLKEETPPVTKQDITEWKEHIMHRLLF